MPWHSKRWYQSLHRSKRRKHLFALILKSGSPVEVGTFSHYLQGFICIPGGCLGFLPSTSSIGNPLISWHSFRPLTLRSMPGMLGDSQPFTGLHTRRGSHIFVPLGVMHHDPCRWVRMILLVDEILHHFFCTLRLTLVLPLWMTQILHHLNDKRHPNIELRGQGDALTCPSYPSKSWCRILSTNRIVWLNVWCMLYALWLLPWQLQVLFLFTKWNTFCWNWPSPPKNPHRGSWKVLSAGIIYRHIDVSRIF